MPEDIKNSESPPDDDIPVPTSREEIVAYHRTVIGRLLAYSPDPLQVMLHRLLILPKTKRLLDLSGTILADLAPTAEGDSVKTEGGKLEQAVRSTLLWRVEADQTLRFRAFQTPMIMVFFMLLTVAGLWNYDVLAEKESVIGDVSVPTIYTHAILWGCFGALLHLATLNLVDQECELEKNRLSVYVARFLIAVMVPVLCVGAFRLVTDTHPVLHVDGNVVSSVNGSGSEGINKLLGHPNSISFLCGYSSRLAIDTINKVIEKASKMVNTLLG